MAKESHLRALKEKHARIEGELHGLLAHPSVDDSTIANLKREKLHLKQEIYRHTE